MYKSKEIRWFKDDADIAIIDWFAGHGQTFEETAPRTDYYLPLNKGDITVKLREGNIEIKHRIGKPRKGKLTPGCIGLFENWIKWSFNADTADQLSQEIVLQNPYDWIKTIKTRIGIMVTEDKSGNLQIVPIRTFVDYGCQIEYTLLKIEDKTFYTFALEWFGDKNLHLPEDLTKEILDKTRFNIEDSMGYAEFLRHDKGHRPNSSI